MSEFDWNEYGWDWKTSADVKEFVELVLENFSTYEYAYETLGNSSDENFYSTWWGPVQQAVKSMATNFERSDIEESIMHLLAPNGYFVECDSAIFDALLKYVPGFPSQYPMFAEAIEKFLSRDENVASDWWDYSWYPFISAHFTWTFWGPETLARSPNVDPEYLTRVFLLSLNAQTPYKSFRARVALATNLNCPTEILEFLYENRNSVDWLLNDVEEEGVFLCENEKYSINVELESISERRKDAEMTRTFGYPTDTNWSSGPGAMYISNLLDVEWEADNAQTCLLAALAKNPALSDEKYLELAKVEHPLVRYFLTQNRSIPEYLRKRLEENKPSFTFQPYGSHPKYTHEITLGESMPKDKVEDFLTLLSNSSAKQLQSLVIEHSDCWNSGDLCDLDRQLLEELGLEHCVVPSVMGAPNVSTETLIFATQLGAPDGDWAAYLSWAIMNSPAITSEILEQTQVFNFDQAWALFLHPLASTDLAQTLEDEYGFADHISDNSREENSAIIAAKLEQGSERTAEEQFQLGEIFYDDKKFSYALPILKSAADQGHDLAAEKTSNCYSKLRYPELAVPYWEFCRTEGNHSANTNYANYLTSIKRNLEFALRLWKEAAEAGIPHAAFNLGVWLKNTGEVENGKLYLKKAGELGYLDGYYVLAGVYYKEQDWASLNEFLAPLLEVGDERAIRMQEEVQKKLKGTI